MGRKELSEELSELRFARGSDEEEEEEQWAGEPGGLDGSEEGLKGGGLEGWGGSGDVAGVVVGRGGKVDVSEKGFAGRVLGMRRTSCE